MNEVIYGDVWNSFQIKRNLEKLVYQERKRQKEENSLRKKSRMASYVTNWEGLQSRNLKHLGYTF